MRKQHLPRVSKFWRAFQLLRRFILQPTLLLILLVVGTVLWFHFSGLFSRSINSASKIVDAIYKNNGIVVENIYLEGQKHQKVDEIIKVLNIKRGEPFTKISVSEIRDKVEELNWVKYAEVEKLYPSTLVVRILEKEPLAIWQNKGKIVLVDTLGEEIKDADLPSYKNLIILVGKDAPLFAGHLFEVLDINQDVKKKVSSAIRVGERRWNVRFFNGTEVKLPEDNIKNAWMEFLKLHNDAKIIDGKPLTIDLRVADKMYINEKINTM